jgi:hypothetical protein
VASAGIGGAWSVRLPLVEGIFKFFDDNEVEAPLRDSDSGPDAPWATAPSGFRTPVNAVRKSRDVAFILAAGRSSLFCVMALNVVDLCDVRVFGPWTALEAFVTQLALPRHFLCLLEQVLA